MSYLRISYPYKYNFHRIICDLFETSDLEHLHEFTDEKYKEPFQVGMDSVTVFHKKFYDKLHAGWPEMEDMYQRFIYYMAGFHEEDFLYQKSPTFRVHIPNNLAVGAYHTDAEFNHPEGEINYIIPLTNSSGTASVWVESEPERKDFNPMIMRVGEFITFNGNKLKHGNEINVTGKTRVSMDFRILPLSKYNGHLSESVTMKTKFVEGEYYLRYAK